MSSIAMLITGIALIIGTLFSVFFSLTLTRTPDNLQGFYGFFYAIISLGGLIGGIVLVVFSFFT